MTTAAPTTAPALPSTAVCLMTIAVERTTSGKRDSDVCENRSR
jgi:hypothetical protein